MLDRVKKLKERFVNAKTEEEKKQIDIETQALINEDREAWQDAMLACLKETRKNAEKLNEDIKIRQQLEGNLEILPLSYIAKTYFKKSRSWLHQRLNEYNVNGKPAKFTDDEIAIFNNALQDISNKIGSLSIH